MQSWLSNRITLDPAICHGKPVVLTQTDGLWDGEHLRHGENILFVPPANPRALADAAALLEGDPALRQRLADCGRRYVLEHGNIKAFADRMEKLCERVKRRAQEGGSKT